MFSIKITCPCSVYPLEPHFYIAKLGYAGVYLFFLFLFQNIDCGYSLEPPRRMKIFFFHNFNNFCILHGRVFVMLMFLTFCLNVLRLNSDPRLGINIPSRLALEVHICPFPFTPTTIAHNATSIKRRFAFIFVEIIYS